MKKLFLAFLWTSLSLWAQAQPTAAESPPASAAQATPDAERTRINRERAQLEKGFAAEDVVCYRKFMVNNCLDDVKLRRREALADLRRQELALEEQERKAKGAAQIQKTEEKQSAEKQQEAADKRAAALRDFNARLEREDKKNAGRDTAKSNEKSNSDAAANRTRENQEKAGSRATRQAANAEEVKKYNERLQKAAERQARHDREQASRSNPPARPLPSPE
jgi:colicin import membrane protein